MGSRPWRSTAIAERASAGRVASSWTAARTGHCRERRRACCRCALSATAPPSRSNRSVREPSMSCATSWSIARLSTASCRRAATCPCGRPAHPTPTRFPSGAPPPRARWTRPPASAAAPASPPAPTAPRRCSWGPSSRTSGCCPQGQPERRRRARALVAAADHEQFGGCSLHGECQAVCPVSIDLGVIARTNQEYLTGTLAAWWRGGNGSGRA